MEPVSETDVPGIGRKFVFKLLKGGILTIIIHSDGRKNLYYREHENDEEPLMFSLTDEEARYVGTILGGAHPIRPTMRTIRINKSSVFLEKTVEELKAITGGSVLVLNRDGKMIPTPEKNTILKIGDELVIVDERAIEV